MYKLLQDDCLNVLKKIPDNSIDLIATDPPYLISATNKGGTINNVKKLNKSLAALKTVDITQGYDIEFFGKEFIRVMKEINIYLWCNKVQIPDYFNFYVNKHKCKFDIICWHKCLHSSTTLAIKDKNNKLKNVPIKDIFRNSDYTNLKVYDGKDWVKIFDVIPNKNVDRYLIIKLRDGNEIKCTLDHRFIVNGDLIEAKKLKVGQILDSTTILIDDNIEPQGITKEMQWFIGHYIAKGNKGIRDNEISISTNTLNNFVKDMIIKVCKQYSATYSIYDDYGSEKSRTIHIRSKIIRGIIEE